MTNVNLLKNKRVLITCGPTWIAIDPVRVLSNRSTGSLGHLIAEELISKKAKVTLVEGPVENSFGSPKVKKIKYRFFHELEAIIKKEVKKHGVIIHAAAVSDFQLAKKFNQKIDSNKTLTLKFTKTKKLITLFKKLNPQLFLVGFKLEDKLTKKSLVKIAEDLYNNARCDLILANEATDNKYQGYVVLPDGRVIDRATSRKAAAVKLVDILEQLA